jgi:hypothetical protein
MLIENLKCVIGHFYNLKTIFLCLTKFETGHLKNFDDVSKQYLSTWNLGALNQGRRVNKAPRFLKKEFI